MKIAFVGASGYGNVGDDVYPLVLAEHLPEHELSFYNSDLPAALPDGLGLLVLGGGGLIYCSDREGLEGHFDYMKWYLDAAKGRGIPFGFAGCGIQVRMDAKRRRYLTEMLEPWMPYLREARFVTLRSPSCVRIVREMGGVEAEFFPDLGYLFDPIDARNVERQRVLTYVPSGAADPKNDDTRRVIEPFLCVGYELVVLSMGAACDDAHHLEQVRDRYPQAAIIAQPSPRDAMAAIARSSFVYTGRYHGLVFARAAGVPFGAPYEAAPYKIREEDLSSDIRRAAGHIETLKSFLECGR
jgi:hypothetical protein